MHSDNAENDIDLAALGPPLARGRTAEVYALPDNRIVKLCYDWVGSATVQREAAIARTVHAAGLPVPAVGAIVQVGARTGVIYARVRGESMLTALLRRPSAVQHQARQLAVLHAAVHAVTVAAPVPAQHDALAHKIRHAAALSPAQVRAALTALDAAPVDSRLCHGDFHPDNVILTEDGITEGGAVIIDWNDATRGRPAADVARTSVILRGVSEGDQGAEPGARALARAFHDAYLTHIFRVQPDVAAEYQQWLPLVAAARLSEEMPQQEPWLVRLATKETPGE